MAAHQTRPDKHASLASITAAVHIVAMEFCRQPFAGESRFMRELVSLSERQQALRLSAYLALQSVETSLEEIDGQWVIWVHRDDDRETADATLKDFQSNPHDVKFENAERKVKHILREAERLNQQYQERQVRLQRRWKGTWWDRYPATYVMIGLCCLVSLICTRWNPPQMGDLGPVLCNNDDSALLLQLGVQSPSRIQVDPETGEQIFYYPLNPDFPRDGLTADVIQQVLKGKLEATVRGLKISFGKGEVWRPFTPMFLHFSLLHILFNMMWLRVLGTGVEFVRGTGRFVLFCLFVSAVSNLAQLFWSGPFFGGMSGVVFGLIGYVWMKGKTQPQIGLGLDSQTVTYSIFWLLMCMTGALGPVANAAHLVGFISGILIGARQAIWRRISFAKPR